MEDSRDASGEPNLSESLPAAGLEPFPAAAAGAGFPGAARRRAASSSAHSHFLALRSFDVLVYFGAVAILTGSFAAFDPWTLSTVVIALVGIVFARLRWTSESVRGYIVAFMAVFLVSGSTIHYQRVIANRHYFRFIPQLFLLTGFRLRTVLLLSLLLYAVVCGLLAYTDVLSAGVWGRQRAVGVCSLLYLCSLGLGLVVYQAAFTLSLLSWRLLRRPSESLACIARLAALESRVYAQLPLGMFLGEGNVLSLEQHIFVLMRYAKHSLHRDVTLRLLRPSVAEAQREIRERTLASRIPAANLKPPMVFSTFRDLLARHGLRRAIENEVEEGDAGWAERVCRRDEKRRLYSITQALVPPEAVLHSHNSKNVPAAAVSASEQDVREAMRQQLRIGFYWLLLALHPNRSLVEQLRQIRQLSYCPAVLNSTLAAYKQALATEKPDTPTIMSPRMVYGDWSCRLWASSSPGQLPQLPTTYAEFAAACPEISGFLNICRGGGRPTDGRRPSSQAFAKRRGRVRRFFFQDSRQGPRQSSVLPLMASGAKLLHADETPRAPRRRSLSPAPDERRTEDSSEDRADDEATDDGDLTEYSDSEDEEEEEDDDGEDELAELRGQVTYAAPAKHLLDEDADALGWKLLVTRPGARLSGKFIRKHNSRRRSLVDSYYEQRSPSGGLRRKDRTAWVPALAKAALSLGTYTTQWIVRDCRSSFATLSFFERLRELTANLAALGSKEEEGDGGPSSEDEKSDGCDDGIWLADDNCVENRCERKRVKTKVAEEVPPFLIPDHGGRWFKPRLSCLRLSFAESTGASKEQQLLQQQQQSPEQPVDDAAFFRDLPWDALAQCLAFLPRSTVELIRSNFERHRHRRSKAAIRESRSSGSSSGASSSSAVGSWWAGVRRRQAALARQLTRSMHSFNVFYVMSPLPLLKDRQSVIRLQCTFLGRFVDTRIERWYQCWACYIHGFLIIRLRVAMMFMCVLIGGWLAGMGAIELHFGAQRGHGLTKLHALLSFGQVLCLALLATTYFRWTSSDRYGNFAEVHQWKQRTVLFTLSLVLMLSTSLAVAPPEFQGPWTTGEVSLSGRYLLLLYTLGQQITLSTAVLMTGLGCMLSFQGTILLSAFVLVVILVLVPLIGWVTAGWPIYFEQILSGVPKDISWTQDLLRLSSDYLPLVLLNCVIAKATETVLRYTFQSTVFLYLFYLDCLDTAPPEIEDHPEQPREQQQKWGAANIIPVAFE